MEFTKINIEATINAPLAKVWDCYSQPEHIVQWNFASPDWCCPRSEVDLRTGGKFNNRMEAKDGSFGFDFEADYTMVVPNQTIDYILADGRKIHQNFIDLGEATTIEITFDAETENSIELQKGGWQAILNNFKQYTESV